MLERMEKQNRIFSGFDADAIDRTTAADLAEVGSDKWTRYPGCIGAFIAEMDYGLAPCIQQAIDSACDHCKLGYIPEPWKRRVAEACAGWQKSHYGWDVDPDIIRVVPDVLEAYEIFLRELVGAGNAVVVPTPAYMPFLSVPKLYDVDVIEIEMLQGTDETTGEREWLFDFDAIERAFAAGCHAFVLCNPHNPVGRVWSAEELEKIGDICVKNGVTVVSDEIHQDFVFKGKHQVFASLKKEFQDISITCTSPSKTFNLASMMISNIFIPNPELRRKFRKQLDAAGTSQLGVLGLVATEAAYSKGEEWYQAMHAYVEANINYTKEYVEKYLPGVKMTDLEGTYLVWLDFRETGLTVEELEDLILNKARLWLDSGKIFGKAGEGFQRINVACPRATLTEALERIRKACYCSLRSQ